MGSSSIHDQRIKTIKSQHSEVVTRLDETLIDFNFLYLSLLKFPVDAPLQELLVGIFHVLWHLWLEERNLSMNSHATNEGFKRGHH